MRWELVKRLFLVGLLAGMTAFIFTACFDDDDPANSTTTISGDTTYLKGLEITPGNTTIIDHSEDDGTTINIIGDFDCAGKIDVQDADTTLRINVTGNANLNCEIEFPATGTGSSQAVIVVDGLINISQGFNPFTNGSVIIVDDETLIKTPAEYAADAQVDDGISPVIMKPADNQADTAAAGFTRGSNSGFGIMARDCNAGAHTISGAWSPNDELQNLDQGVSQEPLVFSVWTECDLNIDNFEIDPPIWADPPPTNGEGDNPPEANGADGRKGMTLNAHTNGKMKFSGNSVLNLMDGGNGQPADHSGNPAKATGGNGKPSGDLKIQAGGGFTFADGATLTINPGKGGDGGDATATGTAGLVTDCLGTNGGNATATGGDGGENKKKLTVRGIDPAGKIFIGGIEGGIGGKGTATGGKGGDGKDGGACNGGNGGTATANGGDGGDASFSFSGTGSLTDPEVFAGDGGDASGEAGAGGKGGDNNPNQGGDGGNGGDSGADAGKKGSEAGGIPMGQAADGTPTAAVGGVGGDCGECNGAGGTGGDWEEKIDGNAQNNAKFDNGSNDCKCDIAGCMDPEATNYNPDATVDDGSCEYSGVSLPGCTDPEAINYDSDATVDDGSCEYGGVSLVCGDGAVNQESENCDGNDLNGADCVSQGYDSGILTCDSGCQYDTSGCENAALATCGDDTVNQAGEKCDGTDMGTDNCESLGYSSGSIACDMECVYDTSGCIAAIATVDSSCAGVTHTPPPTGGGYSHLVFMHVFSNAILNSEVSLLVSGPNGFSVTIAALLNASLTAYFYPGIYEYGTYNWTILSLTSPVGIPYTLSGTTSGQITVDSAEVSCP